MIDENYIRLGALRPSRTHIERRRCDIPMRLFRRCMYPRLNIYSQHTLLLSTNGTSARSIVKCSRTDNFFQSSSYDRSRRVFILNIFHAIIASIHQHFYEFHKRNFRKSPKEPMFGRIATFLEFDCASARLG